MIRIFIAINLHLHSRCNTVTSFLKTILNVWPCLNYFVLQISELLIVIQALTPTQINGCITHINGLNLKIKIRLEGVNVCANIVGCYPCEWNALVGKRGHNTNTTNWYWGHFDVITMSFFFQPTCKWMGDASTDVLASTGLVTILDSAVCWTSQSLTPSHPAFAPLFRF